MSTPEDRSEAEQRAQSEADFRAYADLAREHNWPTWAPVFLTAFARLPDRGEAAKAAGIDGSTAYRLSRKNDAFFDAMEAARNVALDRMESTAYLRATIGTPVKKKITKTRIFKDGSQEVTEIETDERHVSDVLLMFYLKRYRPEFRETFREAAGETGPSAPDDESVKDAVRYFRAEVLRLAPPLEEGRAASNGSG